MYVINLLRKWRVFFLALIFFVGFMFDSSCVFAASATDLSEYETLLLKEVFQKRLESRRFNTNAQALDFLQSYHSYVLQDDVQSKISDEAKFTFDNFLVWEQFHFMWEEDPDDAESWEFLGKQYQKIVEWNASHPETERNEWYSLGSFDIINSFLPKLKWPEVVKYGLEEKKFYDNMIEKNSQNGIIYINAALWYDFAPAIGGGSASKTRKYFETAVQTAESDYEMYFAYVYFSQFEFDNGEMENYEKYMQRAEEILPGSGYLNFVRRLNAAGCSYLDYTKNRSKIDLKVRKFYSEKNEN